MSFECSRRADWPVSGVFNVDLHVAGWGRLGLAGALPLAAAGAGGADAQITSSVVGAVQDSQGGIVPGALVTLSSDRLAGGPATFVTDAGGQYRCASLAPGACTLTATLSGFATYVEEDIPVRVGGTIERRIHPPAGAGRGDGHGDRRGSVNRHPEVGRSDELPGGLPGEHTAPAVQLLRFTKGGAGHVGHQSHQRHQQPGLGPHLGGGRQQVPHDGVNFTAPVSGAAWPWPDTDVIEEIEVVSLGASAEHGDSPGAAFNVVTRQGTNAFRGDAAYFGMFDALTAGPIRVNAAGQPAPGGWGFARARYRAVTTHAGGPIRRDRAWTYMQQQRLELSWNSIPVHQLPWNRHATR